MCDEDSFIHVELVSSEVKVSVEGHSFTHGGNDCKSWRLHTRPHKQDQIFVSSLSKDCNFLLEMLEDLVVIQVLLIQNFDCDVSMPVPTINSPKVTDSNDISQFEFIKRNLPLTVGLKAENRNWNQSYTAK